MSSLIDEIRRSVENGESVADIAARTYYSEGYIRSLMSLNGIRIKKTTDKQWERRLRYAQKRMMSKSEAAKLYNVAQTTISRWCVKLGITLIKYTDLWDVRLKDAQEKQLSMKQVCELYGCKLNTVYIQCKKRGIDLNGRRN